MDWETLDERPAFVLRRSGRFLVADLIGPHRVLSTSARHGGQVDHLRALLNHQSCEGTAHHDRHRLIVDDGLEAYHNHVCGEAGLPAEETAVMGTAANMNYAAVSTAADHAVEASAQGVMKSSLSTGRLLWEVCSSAPVTL